MAEIKWSTPVIVDFPWLGRVSVEGPFQALAVLMDGWPTMAGRHFMKSRIACSSATAGRSDAEEARFEFEQAVIEANEFSNRIRGSFNAKPSLGAAR